MDLEVQLKEKMSVMGFDGESFIENLKREKLMRKSKGMAERRNRFITYCYWAHALQTRHGHMRGKQLSFPYEILQLIRAICPGNINGEIREDAQEVSMQEFCEAIVKPV